MKNLSVEENLSLREIRKNLRDKSPIKVYFNRPEKALSLNYLAKELESAKTKICIPIECLESHNLAEKFFKSKAKNKIIIADYNRKFYANEILNDVKRYHHHNPNPINVYYMNPGQNKRWDENSRKIIYTDAISHNLFILLDEDKVWSGTYTYGINLTYNSNYENLIRMEMKEVADQVWHEIQDTCKNIIPEKLESNLQTKYYKCLNCAEQHEGTPIEVSRYNGHDWGVNLFCPSCVDMFKQDKTASGIYFYECETCGKFIEGRVYDKPGECPKCSHEKWRKKEIKEHRTSKCLICKKTNVSDFMEVLIEDNSSRGGSWKILCEKCHAKKPTEEHYKIISKYSEFERNQVPKLHTKNHFLCLSCYKKVKWRKFSHATNEKAFCIDCYEKFMNKNKAGRI